MTEADWYLGIFLDVRGGDDEWRALATFPDGSAIHLVGDSEVLYRSRGETVHAVSLPQTAGWFHMAWRLADQNRELTLLHNGFPLDRWRAAESLFVMTEGDFVVGRHDGSGELLGVRGWIDELTVLAHDVNPEVACNHARGTLVRVDENELWSRVAESYPAWAHAEVSAAAGGDEAAMSVCFHDYTTDYGAHLANLPAGTTGLRTPINFPEGPLRAGAPRPDSSANAFCLSCHHDSGQGGLSLAALELRPDVMLEHDPRRQPTQPPRRVFGNVPPGWIEPGPGEGSPTEALQAPPGGFLIDRWVLGVAD